MLIKIYIYDTLRHLIPFAQFKNVKNTHGAVLTLLHECFSRFLNCKNGTKSRKATHILNHSINFKSCDVMRPLEHEVEHIFEYISNIFVNHLFRKLGPLIVIGAILKKKTR